MNIASVAIALTKAVAQARKLEATGPPARAEAAWQVVLGLDPSHAQAAAHLGRYAMARGDAATAVQVLQPALCANPGHAALAIDLACTHLTLDQPIQAMSVLEASVARQPDAVEAWLLLGEVREVAGDARGALKAWYQAVTKAQRAGRWHGVNTTPPHLLQAVVHAIATVRNGRRELLFGAFDEVRQRFGPSAVQRVEHALTGYLGDWDATPPNPQQRPRFLYFPGLPESPYLDPGLQPWAGALRDAFPMVRSEALRTLAEDQAAFGDFVQLKKDACMRDYVAGDGLAPAWEAYFFYRRGKRFGDNHQRCPQTSALLEGLDLCRITDQTPEVCFSLLKAGSHILPHYGVSNTRAVMHLPLVVPPGCALNLLGVGEHHWREGELVMFDDTYQHEAWNRSDQHRMILLMDCWNPHLSQAERLAVTQLIETISGLAAADEQHTDAPAS